MENKNQEKELDLIDLINICWKFFVNYIVNPFLKVLKIGLRGWKALLCAIVVGVAISVIVPLVLTKENKSEVILEINVAKSSSFIKDLEVLATMNRDRLSDILEIDNETLQQLVAIKPHKVISKDSTFTSYEVDTKDIFDNVSKEYKAHPSLFALEIISKDTAYLAPFTDAVLHYLNEKSSFAVVNERRLSVMRSELKTFTNEVAVLDSLRRIQYFTNDANQVVLGTSGETFNIKDKNQWIQNELMTLKSRVIKLEETLKNDTLAVEPLTALSITDIYVNHPIKTAPKYALVLFILTYIVLIFCEYKKDLKAWIKE